MDKVISEFKGEYFFLSNFYLADVDYLGLSFTNSEAAFQSAKCPSRMKEFCRLSPAAAKKKGKTVQLRADWEDIKYNVMYEVVKAKFTQSKVLRNKLLDTGDAMLVEGNTWNDTCWGVCKGVGNNHLGKILMRVREELRNEV